MPRAGAIEPSGLQVCLDAAGRGAGEAGRSGPHHTHADYHGVGPLLAPRSAERRDDAALECLRRHELERVLAALAGAGIVPLILKGTALAYSLYRSPVLRPRADTDLLIPPARRADLDSILPALGYHRPNTMHGELVRYQCGYVREDRFGVEHVLDVHWRVSNTQLFARALAYEDLAARAIPIPRLGRHARGLSLPDALLLACMHRAHHLHAPYYVDGIPHRGGDRLIWLHDIHLLLGALSAPELEAFACRAEATGMRAVCLDAILRAGDALATPIPHGLETRLAAGGEAERSAAHLRPGGARYFLTELRSLPGWRTRLKLVREHLFPPASYMLAKYPRTGRAWLPLLYLRRGVHGVCKRMLAS